MGDTQFFGQRIMSTLGNKAVMLGRVAAANDALTEAEEAGVDIQLGTRVWGASGWHTLHHGTRP